MILRFFVGGIIVGATDFGVYYLLIQHWPTSLAKATSFICAGLLAYLINKYWVFQSSHVVSYEEVGRYVVTNVIALGVNVLTNQGVLYFRPQDVVFALIVASMLTGIFTYIVFKEWVFKKKG